MALAMASFLCYDLGYVVTEDVRLITWEVFIPELFKPKFRILVNISMVKA